MNELQLLQRVVDETSRVIDRVSDTEMANHSPCEGWTVRDLVNRGSWRLTAGAAIAASARIWLNH
jgi:hypothetical protein